MWKDIYTDLINTAPLIKTTCKANSDDINKAATKLKQTMSELESRTTTNGTAVSGEVEKQKQRVTDLDNAVKTITKLYEITTLNVLNTKFYKTQYNLYRDIVAGYKQQSSERNTAASGNSEGENLTATDVNNATDNTATTNKKQG
jgi:hypothetical protein